MSNLLENCSICNISNSVLIKISSADKNQVKWSRKLKLCVPAVDWGDDCGICPNCIGQLENAYNFYQLCLQSYEVRKQQAAFAVKLEPCYEPQEDYDVMVTNPIEDEVPSTINACFLPEVHMEPEIECLDVAKIDLKIEDISGNEEECDLEDDGELEDLEEELEYVPSDVNDATTTAVPDLLPSKSKNLYERAYRNFEAWLRLKSLEEITEEVIMTYFGEKGVTYKPSSLWSTYSMLKSMLLLKRNEDISKYPKLLVYLKKNAAGYKVKKSKVFSRFEIDKFLQEAPDKKFLMMKVALIIGLAGKCRCNELTKMTVDDIQDAGTNLIVTIPDMKTNKSKRFVVISREDNQHNITYYRKYVALRPPQTTHRRLFVAFRQGKCSVQPVGIHAFGKIPSKIASYLGLPKPMDYTGYCLRRYTASIQNTGIGNWRPTNVVKSFMEDPLENNLGIENRIEHQWQNYGETSNSNTTNFDEENLQVPKTALSEEEQKIDSDSDQEISCTKPEFTETANSLNILPEKSQKLYMATYNSFMEWKQSKEIDSFSETVLLTYFSELSLKYKPSTLWSHYSMLRSTLNINQGINIESYIRVRALLKRKSKGFRPKKANTFTPEDINKFLTQASDDKYLATKIALIMGIMGACRANEMYSMRIDDLQDLGTAYLVTVPNAKSKGSRKFMITDMFYHICKKYVALRPSHATSNIFFLNYQNGKCTIQRIGINKFTTMGRQIATFLNLPNPEQYSGHSFRRSSATLLVDAGGLLMM